MRETAFDEQMMDAALALARRGRGAVEPNPMVGCVITRDGRIIGQGYHQRFGGPHAEPNALADCAESPRGASAYVTLEPCCHINKKTPPCVPALIAAGIARVIIGCLDPNPAVSGRGVQHLREAGIDVRVGIREPEAKQIIAPFYCRTCLGRPYVTLKWAQTEDGQVGTRGISRQWISNSFSTHLIHELRARSDAILVGINTVRADDPMLSVRGIEPMRPLLRAIADRDLSIAPSCRLVLTAREQTTVVYCSPEALSSRPEQASAFRAAGVNVVPVPVSEPGVDLDAVLRDLRDRKVTHLLVEPGPTLARSFIAANLADRAWIIHAGKRIARTAESIDAVTMPFQPVTERQLEGDRVVEYLNPNSGAFFTRVASGDL